MFGRSSSIGPHSHHALCINCVDLTRATRYPKARVALLKRYLVCNYPLSQSKKDLGRFAKRSELVYVDSCKRHDFRFHGVRHTFAPWYIMTGGDPGKDFGPLKYHMTERYAKLTKRLGKMWTLLQLISERGCRETDARVLFAREEASGFG